MRIYENALSAGSALMILAVTSVLIVPAEERCGSSGRAYRKGAAVKKKTPRQCAGA
jgi:hypothetical protein